MNDKRAYYQRVLNDAAVEMEAVSLITVRDLDTGRCVGFFKDSETVLLAVAKLGINNWVAEQRHPTLDEIDQVFQDERLRGRVRVNHDECVIDPWRASHGR